MAGLVSRFRAALRAKPEAASNLAEAPGAEPAQPDPALEAELQRALDLGRAAWPALSIDEARWVEHLADLVHDQPDPCAAIATLNHADVALSLACAQGQAAALAILEREYLAALPPVLSRMGLTASAIDETLQVLREELLAPRPGAAPRILNYGGRGQLRGWLRSVAARAGLRGVSSPHRHQELDDDAHAAVGDLELEYLKKTYGEAFRSAFKIALAGLPAEDRLLLKQRFRHGLTVEDLGRMHSVHAGTISRWVAAARERLVKATHAEMMRALKVDRAEVASIMRMIHSRLDITLTSLGSEEPSPPSF
jgi:RNA polymerase sigma-70 factor, ECF subfamily